MGGTIGVCGILTFKEAILMNIATICFLRALPQKNKYSQYYKGRVFNVAFLHRVYWNPGAFDGS